MTSTAVATQTIEPPSEQLTLQQLQAVCPASIRKNLTQDMVDMINASPDDVDFKHSFRENLLSFAQVMQEGKYKFADYICAVKYVSHKLLGDGNTLAYSKVFPQRYQRLLNKGLDSRHIAAYSAAYNTNELVAKITQRTLIPIHVMNADILQEAINVQVTLMRSAKSETVRHKAAANLIENLKQPEEVKVSVDVGVSNETIDDLKAVTRALAVAQQGAIAGGHMTANDVAGSKIHTSPSEALIEAEFTEIEQEDPPTPQSKKVNDFFRK